MIKFNLADKGIWLYNWPMQKEYDVRTPPSLQCPDFDGAKNFFAKQIEDYVRNCYF